MIPLPHCYLRGKRVLHRSSFTGADSCVIPAALSCHQTSQFKAVSLCCLAQAGPGVFQATPLQVVPFGTRVVVKNDR